MKRIFTEYWGRLIFATVVGIGLYVAYLSINDLWSFLIGHVDALFISSATLFLFGILSILLNFGAMDIFSYQFRRRRMENGKKEDLYEYTKRKKMERESTKLAFLAYFIVATPFLIGFITCFIILKSSN